MRLFIKSTKLLLISLCLLNITNITTVSVAEAISTDIISTTAVEPRVESTGYMYKYENGVKYKRLWSYSRNCWVDPYWIPCDE